METKEQKIKRLKDKIKGYKFDIKLKTQHLLEHIEQYAEWKKYDEKTIAEAEQQLKELEDGK